MTEMKIQPMEEWLQDRIDLLTVALLTDGTNEDAELWEAERGVLERLKRIVEGGEE